MARVVVNGAVAAVQGDLSITINERPGTTFFLRATRTDRNIQHAMSPRSFDLLLIASAIYVADSLTGRGGSTRPDLGADWCRDMRFVIAVREPEFWIGVHDELAALLEFLTGDRYSFQFLKGSHKPQKGVDLFSKNTRPEKADQVILFSGGLDSLTGAFEALTSGEAALLVTHCSASKTMAVQTGLIRELRSRFQANMRWVGARGHLIARDSQEATQRSRSFLYAALGQAAASLVDASRISFYENGIVSLNLPISRQVVGTMATRTTHPRFLALLQSLLSKVSERQITVDNPYAWMTKSDVVARLRAAGGGALIAKTTSCSNVRNRTKAHPHCGCCSQCLDRRFAVLSAGAADGDPADRYQVDLFLGVRGRPIDATMANDWVRHALALAAMSPAEFAATFGAELTDVVAGHDRLPAGRVLIDAFQMHRRHGDAVRRVSDRVMSELGATIIAGDIPAGSLAASLIERAVRREAPALPQSSSTAGCDDEDALQPIFPLRLIYRANGPLLHIKGLGDFNGAHIGLVGDLKVFLEEDVAASLEPPQHRFIDAGRLGSKGTIRQRAKRCRDEFAAQYECVEGRQPDGHILIHSGHSESRPGYRLDPEARFIDSQDQDRT